MPISRSPSAGNGYVIRYEQDAIAYTESARGWQEPF